MPISTVPRLSKRSFTTRTGETKMWPDRRLLDLIGIEFPIIQAPMAGAGGSAMVITACEAGALGSLPCGMLDGNKVRAEIGVIRQQTAKPINVNFFCHTH